MFRTLGGKLIEPTPLKLLAMIIFASIVVGVSITLYTGYLSDTSKMEFRRDVEEMAETIESLKSQGVGTKIPFEINVPEGSELRFENKSVIAVTNGEHPYRTEIEIDGPMLNPGKYNLLIKRTVDGVGVEIIG